ncbi:serine protease [Streptomyces sp. NPDC005727]|uniref:serine protease n=1 Tax=unclassified Streptomyces TaxID=2593676 RepID=UPI0033C394D8
MQRKDLIHPEFRDLVEIQASEQEALLSKPNVVGVALGYKYVGGQRTDQKSLVALVETKLGEDMLGRDDLVTLSGDTPIDVVEVGPIFAGVGPALAPNVSMHMMDGVMEVGRGRQVAQDFLEQRPPAIGTREFLAPAPATPGLAIARPQALTPRVRPAFGGVSIGHYKITAGTLGSCVYDAQAFPGVPPKYYVLSNNHVLANSNDARIGDPVLQPGPYDGGTPENDTIAWLSRYVPIKYMQDGAAPLNYVDAAIAEADFRNLDRRLYWVGDVKRVNSAPQIDTLVQKCGRTTNYTTGRVLNINATVDVNYGDGRVARFANQILTTPMSAGGDSGSLVCDLEEGAVGLLFAGSPNVTIMNPVPLVEQLLGITITETR